jgi:nitronate monooxygenase
MISIKNRFTEQLNLRYPVVMAPMFLVTNESMLRQSIESGILGCFPSLNYRKTEELKNILSSLNNLLSERKDQPGTYGVNLIVQRSNIYFEKHLEICVSHKVPVYITSLGNPRQTIEAAHSYGAKVFCDVTNIAHAKKCFEMNCDGFVAVGQGAGGHAGPNPLMLLVAALKKHFPEKTVLAAGGIAHGSSLLSVLTAGADAGYVGTRFIACTEASIIEEYKNEVVKAHMENIVMTDRISGTPCTIINTTYAQKIGLHQNRFERYMSRNPQTKKYFKMLVAKRGMEWLEEAVKPGNYHKLWCAGQSVEMINDIKPVKEIVEDLMHEFDLAYRNFNAQITHFPS